MWKASWAAWVPGNRKGEAEDGHGFEGELSKDQLLTDPAEAADFVAKTKVDALAIAIGTSHGAYKFTRKPTGEVLAISRIAEIHKAIPNTHLVMHGSSSVPQEWLEMINKHGGAIPETYGVPVEEIQEGIRNGVRKVNIDTDNRLAFTAAVREAAMADPSNFDPRTSTACSQVHEAGLPGPLPAVLGCRQRQQDPAAEHHLLRRPLRQGCSRSQGCRRCLIITINRSLAGGPKGPLFL